MNPSVEPEDLSSYSMGDYSTTMTLCEDMLYIKKELALLDIKLEQELAAELITKGAGVQLDIADNEEEISVDLAAVKQERISPLPSTSFLDRDEPTESNISIELDIADNEEEISVDLAAVKQERISPLPSTSFLDLNEPTESNISIELDIAGIEEEISVDLAAVKQERISPLPSTSFLDLNEPIESNISIDHSQSPAGLSDPLELKKDVISEDFCFLGFPVPDIKTEQDNEFATKTLKELIAQYASDPLATAHQLKDCFVLVERCTVEKSKLSISSTARKINKANHIPQPCVKNPSALQRLKCSKKSTKNNIQTKKNTDFQCDICSSFLSCRKYLLRHKLIHDRDPLTCAKCNKVFTTKGDLELHKISHKGEYKCDTCGKVYSTHLALSDHMEVHTDSPPTCPVCGFVLASRKYLKDHMATHDKVRMRRFPCPICNKPFASKTGRNNHKRSHSKDIKCFICDYTTCRMPRLKLHWLSHWGKTSFKCHECEKSFLTPSRLRDHKQTHQGNTFLCDLCKHTFNNKSNLYRHMRIVHASIEDKIRYNCTLCSKSYFAASHVKRHMLTHNVKCSSCSLKFQSNASLRVHLTKEHKGGQRFQCSVCPRSCITPEELKRHVGLHNHKPFRCTQCYNTFVSKTNLDQHVTRQHSSTLYCDICSKCFAYKTFLKLHKVLHSQPDTQCNMCEKVFNTKLLAQSHIEMNHSKKNAQYTCETCHGYFSSQDLLEYHQEMHAVEKPHQCDVCNRHFSSMVNLNRHKAYHNKSFTCDHCLREFKCKFSIRRHIRIDHFIM